MNKRVMIIGPQPPAIGGIASIVYLLREGLEGIDFVDSSKPTGKLKSIFHPFSLILQLVQYCFMNRGCKVLFFSSANRSFWEKSFWALAGRIFGARVYMVMVDGNFPEFYSSLSRFGKFLARFATAKATVVGQSKSWGEFFNNIFPESDIKLITGGVDTTFFTPNTTAITPPDAPINVLYVGWIIKEKGIHDILAASELLLKKCTNFKIDLVGPIYCDEEELMLLIKNHGLQEVVTVTGPIHSREALRNKYCSADIFLFPSHYEGFPMALLEAIACGLPCIGSDAGGIPDILDDGQCGKVIKARSPAEIADALSFFIENKDIRLDVAKLSRQRAESNYSNTISVDSYRKLLELETD
jgi:glycosyltransferase involved in cell wall biosynthesis